MKPHFTLLLLATALAPACFNLEGQNLSNPNKFSYDFDAECTCGDTGDLAGCFHEKCWEGENNPDNPDCVCGALTVTRTDTTRTSTAGQAPSKLLGQTQILYLSNQNTVRGVLVADNGLTIELQGADGTKHTYAYDQLDPRSIYRLKKGRAQDADARSQIEVGNYARDVGYYAHAKRHYQKAVDDDPAVEDQVNEEMARLRELASQEELTAASDALAKGDTAAAEKHAATILKEFPEATAADPAAAMLGDIQAREAAMTRSAPDTSAAVAEDFSRAQKAYDTAVEENRKGLLNSRSQSKAVRSFEKALDESDRALTEIAAVLKQHPDSAAHRRYAERLQGDTAGKIIETDLNMVSVYMTRSDYQKALERANHALAIDPSSAEAKQARARIEVAASNDGWGYAGRVRPRRR